MLSRILTARTLELSKRTSILTLTGPRQSGKTTHARMVFPHFDYVNLETGDQKAFALEDPRAFLARFPKGVILDEIQGCPELLPYLQEEVDLHRGKGCRFVLTGSQSMALQQGVSQSLAGRSIQLELLPFSLGELLPNGMAFDPWGTLWKGGYPRIYDEDWDPTQWLPSYIQNYLERDVRQLAQIGDLGKFQVFLQLCAGRIGQMLNLSGLGNEVGVDHKTIGRWISILEASYVVFLLRPHHANFHKRLVKTPKLFFYDTGLACSLLRIRSVAELESHYLRGGLYENFVLLELMKNRLNRGERPNFWFWRDSGGHEIDLLSEEGGKLHALEIKASSTVHSSQFDGLHWFAKLAGDQLGSMHLVNAGTDSYQRSGVTLHGWKDLATLRI